MVANIFFLDSAKTCNYFLQSQGHYIGRFSPGNWCSDLSNLFSNDRKPTQRDCNRSQTDCKGLLSNL